MAVKRDKEGSYVMVDTQEKKVDTQEGTSESTQGEKRYITIGQTTEQYVEVVEGLEEGEIILIQPNVARATELMMQLNPSFMGGTGNQQIKRRLEINSRYLPTRLDQICQRNCPDGQQNQDDISSPGGVLKPPFWRDSFHTYQVDHG